MRCGNWMLCVCVFGWLDVVFSILLKENLYWVVRESKGAHMYRIRGKNIIKGA